MTPEPMKGDRHEPDDLTPLLDMSIPYLPGCNLNDEGYADYFWTGADGESHQVERKTWHELLADLDSVEDQVRRELQAHPEVHTKLLVEGVVLPDIAGTTVYHRVNSRHGSILTPSRTYDKRLSSVLAWLYQVGKFVEVYFSSDLNTTALTLVAFYNADQKEVHETFRRHFKKADWHPNPQVRRLLGASIGGVHIGPEKAEALIRRFGTCWNVVRASPEELQQVPGIGMRLARDLLRGFGRPDV